MLFWIQIMENYEDKCFLALFLKAFSIKKKFKLYDSEKKYAKNGKESVSKCNCSEISKCKNSGCHSSNAGVKKIKLLKTFLTEEGSMWNFILKSAFGFIGGILLTYIFFIFLVFSLNFTLKKATYICMGLGVILSLGLAFSVRIRCTVFLCIPQLFSKRGRQALLAYAFILALSGPAKNTLHNVEVMSESLACRQEQLRQVENELLKCVQKPNSAAKKSIEKLLEKINSAVKDFKNFILELYRTCYDILQTVLQGQKWLYSITTLCQKKTGRPSTRCLYFLREASDNCQDISSADEWTKMCRIPDSSQAIICSVSGSELCSECDVPQPLPVASLKNHLSTFKHRAMNIFNVRVEAHQTYSQSNRSNIRYEEVQGVATEIRQKTDQFLQYFDFMSLIFGIFILVLFMKVIIYRYKFLTDVNYDNRYITHDFVDIDRTRAEFKMETLLPLEPREKTKYIKVTSIRLVPCEKVRLMSSFVFLLFASFKIIIHMLTDSSLNWILSNIRRDEKLLYMSSLREEEPSLTVRVEGDGLVAAFVRNMTKVVKRQSASGGLDPTPCLPDPIPPDWNRYYQILALVVICWVLALCEPYGLRLRHTVMVTYHPDRARERAIWLYNQIISDRSSFVKFARRDIRKRYKDVPKESTLGFRFFLKKSTPKCLLCKVTLISDFNRVKCTTFNCPGLFCVRCYDCLKLCSICKDPAEYDDLSDVSEEKDSSEEEKTSTRSSKKRRITFDSSVRKAKKVKEGLQLNFRKPSFFIDRGGSKEIDFSKKFIRPKVLKSLSYCSKSSASRKELKPEELESSDWNMSNSESLKTTTATTTRTTSTKCSTCSGKNVEKKSKPKKKNKTGVKSLQNESETCSKKIRLFRKLTEFLQDRDDFFTCHQETVRRTPKPDFLFKRPLKGPSGDIEIKAMASLSKAKQSIEKLKKKLSEKFQLCEKKLSFKDLEQSTKATDTLDCQSEAENLPTPLNVKYYEIKETKYPFIDPSNIHEISHKWSKSTPEFEEEDFECYQKTVTLTTESSRVRVRFPEDTDSIQENVNLTITEQMTQCSSGFQSQFKGQPSKVMLKKKNSRLKRTIGKLNLDIKIEQFASLYKIETDSSNEKFLSVKPTLKTRRKRKRKRKFKRPRGESKEILKMTVTSPKWTKKKKVSGLTSNVLFFKKRMADQKMFEKERSLNYDAKYVPNSTIFLSDEEFDMVSKSLRGRSAFQK